MHSILHSAATSYSTGILHKSHKGFISLKKPFLEERFFLVEIAGFTLRFVRLPRKPPRFVCPSRLRQGEPPGDGLRFES